jgi:zinc transport system ATP-binding protein
MTDKPGILTCQNAALGYDGHIVISGLNFSIQSGDYLCIVGENGVGKTSLVNCILRLLNPIQGTITLSGDIKRNEIGYLSQQTAAKKDFPAGVHEIIQSGNIAGMGLRPFYSAGEKQRTEETMHRLGITDLKHRCFRELSGGQQRRVLIGRALCASRKLLVLDEPAAGLDPIVTSEVYALLKRINQEMRITIIMISHDIEEALKYAKLILHLKKTQSFFGNTSEYIRSDTGKQFLKIEKQVLQESVDV